MLSEGAGEKGHILKSAQTRRLGYSAAGGNVFGGLLTAIMIGVADYSLTGEFAEFAAEREFVGADRP